MIPSSFPESNGYFDKPKGMTRDQCDALATFAYADQETGIPVVISCWKPTKEELEEINHTGRIWVYHFGLGLQPHAVSGHNPFTPIKEVSNDPGS